jgi:hypothetical protein
VVAVGAIAILVGVVALVSVLVLVRGGSPDHEHAEPAVGPVGPCPYDVVVFVDPGADPGTLDRLGRRLERHPEVGAVAFVDRERAFREFGRVFADRPEVTEEVGVERVPPLFLVDAVDPERLVGSLAGTAGVRAAVPYRGAWERLPDGTCVRA